MFMQSLLPFLNIKFSCHKNKILHFIAMRERYGFWKCEIIPIQDFMSHLAETADGILTLMNVSHVAHGAHHLQFYYEASAVVLQMHSSL